MSEDDSLRISRNQEHICAAAKLLLRRCEILIAGLDDEVKYVKGRTLWPVLVRGYTREVQSASLNLVDYVDTLSLESSAPE